MKNKFVKQLGFLGIIGVVIKIIGALYRVPIGNFVSEQAVAYYSIAYPWFTTLVVISTGALPAVIAKMTAEAGVNGHESEQEMIFAVSRKVMTGFGVLTMILLFIVSGIVSKTSGYPESLLSFYVLAIGSFFVALNAAYRGYFQGIQRLEIFGISQLLEQIGRVVTGLSLVFVVVSLQMSDAVAAAAATSGAAFGAVTSFIYSTWQYKKIGTSPKVKLKDHQPLIKRIVKMAIPIALGASIMPLLSIIDSTMVIWRLRQIGFGDLSGVMFSYIQFYSAPIINLAQVVFTALQVSLLPMVTKAFTQKSEKLKEKVHFGILLALGLGLPMGLGISVYAKPILLLLYPARAETIVDAAPVLSILGLGVAFLSIYQASTGILQGLNHYKRPVKHLAVGAVVKVVTGYILLGIPSINIKGAAISTLLAYAIAGSLNFIYIFRIVKCPTSIVKKLIGVVVANVIMIVLSRVCFTVLMGTVGSSIALLASILVAVVIYAGLILGTKLITLEDLKAMEDK